MKMLGGLLMVGLLVCEAVASAQGKKEPPRRSFSLPEDSSARSSEAALPKIDLPEFMITGNETISLHDFSKSSVDDQWSDGGAGREAGPGVREASGTRLGGVQKEQVNLLSLNKGFSAKVQAGYGSYITPYLDGWFGNSFSGSDFLLKAGYKSSEGHVPNADYSSGHASLAGGTHLGDGLGFLSGSDVRAQFGLQGKSYRLYGSALPAQQRTLTSFGVNLSIGSSYNEMPYSSKFSLQSTTMEDALRTTETALGMELGLTKDVGDVSLKGEVTLWRSFYSAASAAEDPFYMRFGVNAQYQLAKVLDIRGGLVFHLVRGSDTRTLGRLYPRLAVSWFADEWITLFARFEPGIQRSSLSSFVEASPYIVTDVRLRHQMDRIDFSCGAEADFSRMIRTRFYLKYTQSENTPIFVDPLVLGVWDVMYVGTTRIVSVNGEAYADITDEDNLSGSFSIRTNNNSSTNNSNPYFPSFLAGMAYQHRFPFGLSIGATIQMVGRQYTDLAESRSLSGFAALDVKAEYSILPRWNAVLMLGNLFDQKQTWWQGYSGLGRSVSLGTSFAW